MELNISQNGKTVRDYLRVIFRQKAVFISTIIITVAAVYVGLKLKTPTYEARVKVLVSAEKQVQAPYYNLLGYRNTKMSLTQSKIVKSNPVIERAVRTLEFLERPLDYEKLFCSPLKASLVDLELNLLNRKLKRFNPEQKQVYLFRRAVRNLKKNIKIKLIRDTDLFTIIVRDWSHLEVAIIANVVSRSYIIFDLEQQLVELQMRYGEEHLSVRQLKDSIEKMTKNLNDKPISHVDAIGPASVKIIEQATIPLKHVGFPKAVTLAISFVMSIFLGILLTFLFEYFDQTFKSPQDIEKFLSLPCLGTISKKNEQGSYKNLSEQIYLLMKDKNLKSILITAALYSEGATAIITNIGKCMADQAGLKTLIIDANLRDPSIHKMFDISKHPCLTDVLEGKSSFEEAISEVGPNLTILSAVKTVLNPITLLDSHNMSEVIKTAQKEYQVIFINCANLNDFKDAVVFSSYLDGVAVVVDEGRTRRQIVGNAIVSLEQSKANIIGVILNNHIYPIPKVIYENI